MSTALAPLWAISAELTALLDCIETCPVELEAELQERISLFMGAEAEKTDQVSHVLAALEYEQKAAGDEITRLQERKKAAAKAQERLEAYVCRVIQARGVKALKGNTNTLSVRPSDAVVITDEALLLPEYIIVKIVESRSIDKAAIKKALKAGEEIPGADLEYRTNLVRK